MHILQPTWTTKESTAAVSSDQTKLAYEHRTGEIVFPTFVALQVLSDNCFNRGIICLTELLKNAKTPADLAAFLPSPEKERLTEVFESRIQIPTKRLSRFQGKKLRLATATHYLGILKVLDHEFLRTGRGERWKHAVEEYAIKRRLRRNEVDRLYATIMKWKKGKGSVKQMIRTLRSYRKRKDSLN